MSEIEREILIAVISTSGIIIILVAAFIFFILLSQRQKRIKTLESFNAVLNAQEKEQERIARDLHDQIGPQLSIIKSQILCIDDEGLSEEDKRIKMEVSDQLGFAINEVRSIAHNLIPGTFNEYGFLKSVEYYIYRLKEFNNIGVEFTHSSLPVNIAKNYEMSLFRILLELFQNTLKHSKATKVILDLRVKKNKLCILFSDNGIGIANTKINHKGIGIKNIDTRVNFLKGSYEFETTPGVATRYFFTFDLENLYDKK